MSLFLADTSVWSRLSQPAVARRMSEAVEADAIVMTAPILLELLRSARNAAELRSLAADYDALHQAALTAEVIRRAREVQAVLAVRGYHRGPSPVDLLTAAAAESVGATVWHCDRHFELIAEVTGQKEERLGR